LFGKDRHEAVGQLALLDAMVFFLVATTMSAALWCHADLRRAGGDAARAGPTPATGDILSSFLRASICRGLVVRCPEELAIRPDTPISACIMYEAEGLLRGADPSCFAELNQVLDDVLVAVAGTLWHPCLSVYLMDEQAPAELLTFPPATPEGPTAYSASAAIPCSSGVLLVTLVLTPSSLPELAEVT